jgi:hypothetical protein
MVNILDANAQFELLGTKANGRISGQKRVGDRVITQSPSSATQWIGARIELLIRELHPTFGDMSILILKAASWQKETYSSMS